MSRIYEAVMSAVTDSPIVVMGWLTCIAHVDDSILYRIGVLVGIVLLASRTTQARQVIDTYEEMNDE